MSPGFLAVRAGMRARAVLLRRRLELELGRGTARAVGMATIAVIIAATIFGVGFGLAAFVTLKGAPELVRTGTALLLHFISGALVLSSLGHAAQCFFSAKDLWLWDSTPAPAWARFTDRATETAVAAAPTTLALGVLALLGIAAGGALGPLAMLRACVAVVLVASVPVSVGILLAHLGGAMLPAGALRRVSLLILGVTVCATLVWFRSARIEKVLTPEGAAQLLANAKAVKEVGPALLPSSLGASFVVDGDGVAFLGLLAWAVALFTLAFGAHRFLSRRARDLAVDESPVGLIRGSAREDLLKLAVRLVPLELRPVVQKDLLAFFRDPAQWGQVLLLLGVGALYLVNASILRDGFGSMQEIGAAVLPAMHVGLVTFIAAGLSVRFGFPQIGLEGPAVWIVDGSPLKPRALMSAKVFAGLPVVVIYPGLVAVVGGFVLHFGFALWVLTTILCVLVSLGVCAFAVGRGAIDPLFDAASLSELAIGPGALSTMLLSVSLAFFASIGALCAGTLMVAGGQVNLPALATLTGATLAVLAPSVAALWAGRRALDKGAVAFVKRREDEATRRYLADVERTIVVDQ